MTYCRKSQSDLLHLDNLVPLKGDFVDGLVPYEVIYQPVSHHDWWLLHLLLHPFIRVLVPGHGDEQRLKPVKSL